MSMKALYAALILVMPFVSLAVCRLVRVSYARIRGGTGGVSAVKLPPGFVRHSIDTLPMGMLFCHTNGHVLLKNLKMDALCETLTGHVLVNGKLFMEELLTCGFRKDVRVDGTPELFSVITKDTAYTFRREELTVNGRTVLQLTAYDTMELFAREAQLKERLAELKAKGKRLAAAAEHAENLAKSEELLSAKVHIHDMVGQVLLSARYVLTEADDARMTEEQVLAQVRQTMESLLESGEDAPRDAARTRAVKKSLAEAASAMGLKLSFEGEMPDESTRVVRMLTSGARVCMTNAVRHGMARNMVIRLDTDEEMRTRIVFANDGNPPAGDTAEGGGLRSLKTQLDSVGGTLRFVRDAAEMPAGCRFAVVLEIP